MDSYRVPVPIKTPAGETVQIQGEGGRTARPSNPVIEGGKMEAKNVREIILATSGWFKSRVIKEKLGSWGNISGKLRSLIRQGKVRNRRVGKSPNGMPIYEYKVIKGAL